MPATRNERLEIDAAKLERLSLCSDLIEIRPHPKPNGAATDRWSIVYRCRGIIGVDAQGHPKVGDEHRILLQLPPAYPKHKPTIRAESPTWHPNIQHLPPHYVCIGRWTEGRQLDDLVIEIGEMIQYKNYDISLDGEGPLDEEVAAWARRAESQGIIGPNKPIDQRDLQGPMAPTPTNSRVRVRPVDARVDTRSIRVRRLNTTLRPVQSARDTTAPKSDRVRVRRVD